MEVSDFSVEFMNITFSFYVNSKHWLCNDDGKVAEVYRAYTCTTYVHLQTVLGTWCRDRKERDDRVKVVVDRLTPLQV